MTPKIIWSAFTLTLLILLILPETSVSIFHPDNKVEDHEKFQDKFPRFASKKFKKPNLFVKTSPSVFQTPSLHPSIYGTTSEQTTTSPHQAFEDSVDLTTVSTATDNENDRNLFVFLSSLAHKKLGWKKYLVHLYECNDTPTQPPPFSNPNEPSLYPSIEPSVYPSTKPSSDSSIEPSISSLPPPSNLPTSTPSVSNAPSDEPSMEPSSIPSRSTLPSYLPSNEPSNIPTNSPINEPSTEPTNIPSLSLQPTTLVEKNHNFEWKINTTDIDRAMRKKAEIAQGLKKYLSHLLRCSEAKIKNVKLVNSTGELLVKGVCFGFRTSCAINLSEDECNDNSVIDDFVAERMLEISSTFDYKIDLSISFDFDSDDISVVPGFLSELIEAGSKETRAVADSNGLGPPEVNNEAILIMKKDADNSNFHNEARFQHRAIEFEGLISLLEAEDISITEKSSSDDVTLEFSYYVNPRRKCGNKCAEEQFLVEKIFTYYDVDFDDTIDVCFWDDINCNDDSVTQIFLRKY